MNGPTLMAGQCHDGGHRDAYFGCCELDGLDVPPTMHGLVVSEYTEPVPHLHIHLYRPRPADCADWLRVTRQIGYGTQFRLAGHYRRQITVLGRDEEWRILARFG